MQSLLQTPGRATVDAIDPRDDDAESASSNGSCGSDHSPEDDIDYIIVDGPPAPRTVTQATAATSPEPSPLDPAANERAAQEQQCTPTRSDTQSACPGTEIEKSPVALYSKCRIFNTMHLRNFQLAADTAGSVYLSRFDGQELREVSVVTSETTVETTNDGQCIMIKHLQPDLSYCLIRRPSDDSDTKIDQWVKSLQGAIARLQTTTPVAPSLKSTVQIKNPLSLTWHTRTMELVSADDRFFIRRSCGDKLRHVCAVTPDTTAVPLGSHDLRIVSLEPKKSYHVRFIDGGCDSDSDSVEREEWLDVLKRDTNVICSPSARHGVSMVVMQERQHDT